MADPDGKSEPYQVVARRFRPKTFDELVGQEAIQNSLRSALQSQRIPHAFLFAGSRGVGKTTTARILARCLNCERGPTPDPCGTCALCTSILDGSNPDVVEADAASHNSVEDIRAMCDRVAFASMRSRYKVWILDEVHMLSKSAWNAFLKTLEEPPPQVVFVLATTELHKVPETIRSRCQVLLFKRIGDDDIVRRLQRIAATEGTPLPRDLLAEIAAASKGGMRDAETALERILPLARELGPAFDLQAYRRLVQRVGSDAAVEVAQALLDGDAARGLRFCAELQQHGIDEREALGDLVDVLRSCLLLKVDGPDSPLVALGGELRQKLQALAAATDMHRLEAVIQAGLLGRERLRRLEDRAAVLDLTMVRMAQAGSLPTLGELCAAVRDGGALGGAAAPPGGAAAPGPAAQEPPSDAAGLRARLLAAFQDQALLRATLELCRFEGPGADGRVVVHLETDRRLHRDRLAAPALQQQITAEVQRALGRPAAVAFAIAEPPAKPAPAAAPPPGPAARRVLERFGGRIVAVDPDERPARPEPPGGAGEAS